MALNYDQLETFDVNIVKLPTFSRRYFFFLDLNAHLNYITEGGKEGSTEAKHTLRLFPQSPTPHGVQLEWTSSIYSLCTDYTNPYENHSVVTELAVDSRSFFL